MLEVFADFWLLALQLWARTALALLTLCLGLRSALFLLDFGPSGASVTLQLWPGPCFPGLRGGPVFLGFGFGLWGASALLEWRFWLQGGVVSITHWFRSENWMTLGALVRPWLDVVVVVVIACFLGCEDLGSEYSDDVTAVLEELQYS